MFNIMKALCSWNPVGVPSNRRGVLATHETISSHASMFNTTKPIDVVPMSILRTTTNSQCSLQILPIHLSLSVGFVASLTGADGHAF